MKKDPDPVDVLVAAAAGLSELDRLSAVRRIAATITPPAKPTIRELSERLSQLEPGPHVHHKPGDVIIQGFRRWLDRSVGENAYPPALLGDLTDLLFDLEAVYAQLACYAIAQAPRGKHRVMYQLLHLRHELTDHIPATIRGVNLGIDATVGPE